MQRCVKHDGGERKEEAAVLVAEERWIGVAEALGEAFHDTVDLLRFPRQLKPCAA